MLARNILIFHAGALGDFIQTWPLGLALGRLYPQSRIIFVTQRQKGQLAEKLLSLESIDVESGWHHLFGDPAKLPETCRTKIASAHTVITFFARPGDTWTTSVASIAPKAQIISIESGPAHQIHRSLSSWPIIQTAMSQILASIADRGLLFKRPADAATIALHLGAGSPTKCWPLDSWLTLIQRLRDSSHPCKILLGEVELDRWPPDQIRRLESAAQTLRPPTYLDLLNELATSRAFIGNDTGPSHLAAIIGLPTITLFGPTNPTLWKPLGPHITTLHKQPIDSITVDEVIASLRAIVP